MKWLALISFLMISLFSNAQFISNGKMETVETVGSSCSPSKWKVIDGSTHLVSIKSNCRSRTPSLEYLINFSFNSNTVLYISNNHGHQDGESAGQLLSEKLIKGQQYKLSFIAVFKNDTNLNGDHGTNKPKLITSFDIGAPNSKDEIGQSHSDTTELLNEEQWTSVSICFVAPDTGISHLTFSNFNIPENSRTEILIDNVKLEESPAEIEISNDIELCEGDTVTLEVKENHDGVFWSGPSIPPSFESSYQITAPGTYWVAARFPCSIVRDTITVRDHVNPQIAFDFDLDSNLCAGDTVQLEVNYPNASYLWQNNSTDSAFTVTEKGTYWVEITDVCDSTASDTIDIDYGQPPELDLGEDLLLCNRDSLTINIDKSEVSYLWHDGSTFSNYTIYDQGTYWLEVANKCGTASDTIEVSTPSVPIIKDIDLSTHVILSTRGNSETNYQWIFCDSTPIQGAMEPNYVTSFNANYAIIAERDGCIDTSNCILVGIEEIPALELTIHPNPTRGILKINWPLPFKWVKVSYWNMLGQLISQKEFSDSEELIFEAVGSKGNYLLEIQVDNLPSEFFKIIKQ